MADPLSLVVGIVALVSFGIESSKSLSRTIESFKSHKRSVRELKQELDTLSDVLQSLEVAIKDYPEIEFMPLRLPLSRCNEACKEFEATLLKCTSHAGSARTSFRDWAKVTYMGSDIATFKSTLSTYKSTICIALGGINLYAWSTVSAGEADG